MKNPIFTYLFLLCISLSVNAQVKYDDVVVFINGNSLESVEIGNYFKAARNIPSKNIISVNCVSDIEIDSITYEKIREQMLDSLLKRNLLNSTNYLVMVKGIPIKVRCTACYSTKADFSRCSSFDSEMTLLGSNDSLNPYRWNRVSHPYYQSNEYFSRRKFGNFLVTRLDGVSKKDVLNLIDNNSPDIPVSREESRVILNYGKTEYEEPDQILANYFLEECNEHKSNILNAGWKAEVISDTTKINNYDNILYYSNRNWDLNKQSIKWNFLPGSIGNQIDAYKLSDSIVIRNDYNSLPFFENVSNGISGIGGYAYLHFENYKIEADKVFLKYTNPSVSYNLAESFYSNIRFLASMYIVIGDPKTSLKVTYPLSVSNEPMNANGVNIFPNPSIGRFHVNVLGKTLKNIKVLNSMGQLIVQSATTEVNVESLNLKGIFFIHIETSDGSFLRKIMLE